MFLILSVSKAFSATLVTALTRRISQEKVEAAFILVNVPDPFCAREEHALKADLYLQQVVSVSVEHLVEHLVALVESGNFALMVFLEIVVSQAQTASLDLSAKEANALPTTSSISLDLVKAALVPMLSVPQASCATEVLALPLQSKRILQEKAKAASSVVSVPQALSAIEVPVSTLDLSA